MTHHFCSWISIFNTRTGIHTTSSGFTARNGCSTNRNHIIDFSGAFSRTHRENFYSLKKFYNLSDIFLEKEMTRKLKDHFVIATTTMKSGWEEER
jgi:hypothetical protein